MDPAMVHHWVREWEVSITKGSCGRGCEGQCHLSTTDSHSAGLPGASLPNTALVRVHQQHQLTRPAPNPPSPHGALGDSRPSHHRPTHMARNSLTTNAQSHTLNRGTQ